MADIFKLIKGMSHTERPTRSKAKNEDESFEKRERLNLDNFIVGEEEKRFQERKKRTSIQEDFLDEEIGTEQEKKDFMKDIVKLDFIELSKDSDKKQNLILKREYLTLLDKLEELSSEIDKLSRTSSTSSVELHQAKKETYKLKELIRLIGAQLPEGTDFKRILDNTTWSVSDIEKELMEKIQFIINRAKNADDYIEEKIKKMTQENKNLKRLILQMESDKTRLEQELSDAQANHSHQEPIQEYTVEEIQPEPEVDLETLREEAELAEMERAIAEKRNKLKESATAQPAPAPIAASPKPQPTPQPPAPKPTPPPPAIYDEPTEVMAEEEEEEISTHLLLDVERHLELLPEARRYIIEAIGKTGISRNQELRVYLEADEKGKQFYSKAGKFSYQDMSAATKGLKDSGYLTNEKVNLGSKGGYNFQVFELSDMGKAIYHVLTKGRAVTPEKKNVIAQHKSLEHGYLIKDCAIEFEEMGYTVYTERQDLRFDLPNGKRKDFDLIIEKNNEKCYIEVERGTHTDEDFFNAMNKIYQVMQQQNVHPAPFHFISPNEQTLFGKTKRQFFLWIKQHLGGIEEVKGKIVVNFTTFDKVKKRQTNMWETIIL